MIFDEPETHLHPNIAGRLLRTIHKILEKFNSYGIIATHSPVILQEVPSRYIRVFDRRQTQPLIFQPPIECFGENLTEISNTIFKVDQEDELYREQLDDFISQNLNYNEVNNIFNDALSLNARLYLLNQIRKDND